MARARSIFLIGVLFALLALGAFPSQRDTASADPDVQLIYEIKAKNPTLNRLVTGDVVAYVDGVPAEPVDSFVWDGVGSVAIEGSAKLKIDPVGNTGEIKAKWTDENGTWEFRQTMYAPPPHATGLRVGASATSTELVVGDPITTNVYLHGDTGAGGPILPTVFNLLATWGPAEVKLNGKAFNNPFDGPAPLWAAHTMTTVGVRNEDGTVRTLDGGTFNPLQSANGAVDQDDLEFHLVFHEAPGPVMTANFPPPHAFFYHLTFEDVKIDIAQKD